MSILGWVLAWCVSGVSNVTEDFGAEISKELSRGESVVRMWVQLKRWCVSCVGVLQKGHRGDGCDLASTLC